MKQRSRPRWMRPRREAMRSSKCLFRPSLAAGRQRNKRRRVMDGRLANLLATRLNTVPYEYRNSRCGPRGQNPKTDSDYGFRQCGGGVGPPSRNAERARTAGFLRIGKRLIRKFGGASSNSIGATESPKDQLDAYRAKLKSPGDQFYGFYLPESCCQHHWTSLKDGKLIFLWIPARFIR